MLLWLTIVCADFSNCLKPTQNMTETCQCLEKISAGDIDKLKVFITLDRKHLKSYEFISRPGRSQGLLYEHLCNSLTDWSFSSHSFTAPRRQNG